MELSTIPCEYQILHAYGDSRYIQLCFFYIIFSPNMVFIVGFEIKKTMAARNSHKNFVLIHALSSNYKKLIPLKLKEGQDEFTVPATAAQLMAVYEGYQSFMICFDNAEKTVIGHVVFHIYEKARQAKIMHFMIDGQHQGKGYGTRAFKQILLYIERCFRVDDIFLLVDRRNTAAVNLYKKCGFSEDECTADDFFGFLITDNLIRMDLCIKSKHNWVD